MNSAIKTLGLDRLPLTEQLQLVEDLWDEIALSAEAIDVPQSHLDLLDRRIADHEASPSTGSTWAEVKARLARDSDRTP